MENESVANGLREAVNLASARQLATPLPKRKPKGRHQRPTRPGATRAVVDAQPGASRLRPAPRPLYAAGRNDPCPCGSGKRFKRCCINEVVTEVS